MDKVDIEKMTIEEALDYMGLPHDANDFAIDEKFWKLSKKYRGDKSPESEKALNELSAVYNIACGRRDEALRKSEAREKAAKFLGKTKAEWKNYFAYSWFKILIIAIVVLSLGSILYGALFKNRYDSALVAFGHFNVDTEVLGNKIKSQQITNPYISALDMVVPNDEGETKNIYADQSLASVMTMEPGVIITDSMTYEYYYSYLSDVSSLYSELKNILTAEQYAKIEPVYLSEREAFITSKDYLLEMGLIEAGESEEDYSAESVFVGFRIKDRDAIASLGFVDLWPKSDPDLIISVYSGTSEYASAKEMIKNMFQNMA